MYRPLTDLSVSVNIQMLLCCHDVQTFFQDLTSICRLLFYAFLIIRHKRI